MAEGMKEVFSTPLDLGDLSSLINDEVSLYQDDPSLVIEELVNETTSLDDADRKIEESRMFILEERVNKTADQERSRVGQAGQGTSSTQSRPSSQSYSSQQTTPQSSSSSSQQSYGYGQQKSSSYGGTSSYYGSTYVSPEEARRRAAEEADRKAKEEAIARARKTIEEKQNKFYNAALKAEGQIRIDDEDIFSRMAFYEKNKHSVSRQEQNELVYDCYVKRNSISRWLTTLTEIGQTNNRRLEYDQDKPT